MNLQPFWYAQNPLIAKIIPTQQMVHGRLFTPALEVQPVCFPHSHISLPLWCPLSTPGPVRFLRMLSSVFFADQNRYASSDMCLSYLTIAVVWTGYIVLSFVLCHAVFAATTEENTVLLSWCCVDSLQECVVIQTPPTELNSGWSLCAISQSMSV